MMFYEGDLQSGIAASLRESKSVVCFVRGAGNLYELERYRSLD